MKKLLPIIIVLALIGGIYYFFTRGGQTGNLSSTTEMFQGSLEMAVSRGVPLKCEWEDEGMKATTYVKGETIYTETQTEGTTQYAIVKDNCTWSWSSAGEQAVKFCSEDIDYSEYEPEVEVDDSDVGEDEVVETEAPQYNCVPTAVSDSMFEPPTDIDFVSY